MAKISELCKLCSNHEDFCTCVDPQLRQLVDELGFSFVMSQLKTLANQRANLCDQYENTAARSWAKGYRQAAEYCLKASNCW